MYKNFTKKLGVPNGYVHNLLRIMRLTTVILIATFMQVSAASFAQRVTLNEHNASLENVLKEIRQQTGYDMIFDRQLILKADLVTITVKDVSVDDALTKIIAKQSLAFSIEDKTITIKEKEPTLFDKIKKALTPPTDIIGRVTNEQGQPLNGATVTIKRTQSGTLTDANGNFTVRGVSPSDTLVVSYLGYARAFIRVGDQTSLKIVLEVTSNQLDQVVIQAYGETSQRLATGSIGGITAKDIEKQPVSNVLEALQGQVPGVVVTNVSGFASAALKVEIRGRNTIDANSPSDPLYIIDGVPLTILGVNNDNGNVSGGSIVSQGMIQSGVASPAGGQSPLFSLNPLDIESIEVLKDADATAIYGSRASNGVILITTKKGKAGKTHADVSVYTGYNEVPKYYSLLNTQQYITIRKEALSNDGQPVNLNTAPDLTSWDVNRYTDWQKFVWGKAGKIINAQTSISGGDAQTTFRAGAGFTSSNDITSISGGNYRGSLSLNLNHSSLNQKLKFSWSTIYTVTSVDLINIPNVVTLAPDAPAVYNSFGNLNYAGWSPISYNYPFGVLLQPYTSKTNLLNSNIGLQYEIAKGLVLKTNFGYNNSQTYQTQETPIASQNPLYNPTGRVNDGYTYFHNVIVEPQLEYNSFINKGKLNILLGGTAQDNKTDGLQTVASNYTNDLLLSNLNAAPTRAFYISDGEYKYTGIYGRINYNWENQYILNLNGRRDGSSKFGAGKQFGNFGSIGGAWIFSENSFAKQNLPVLSFGKLRGSYGITGGDQIGNYGYLSLWQFGGPGNYNGTIPVTPIGPADSLLHWQVNKKLELAIDLGFFKDRLTVEASWYRDRCDDQLVTYPLPALSGFTSVTSNSPASVQNTGWEFILNAIIVQQDKFRLSIKGNIGINRNKLLAYPDLAQSPYANSLVIGQPLYLLRLLHFTGVDPETGQYTFEDKNKDGKITTDFTGRTQDDRNTIDMTPKYDGGVTFNFAYKNFSLSSFFYFKKQLGYNALNSLSQFPGTISNQSVNILNRWQKPGDITNVAKLTTQGSTSLYNYYYYSDAKISDASFVRLQNLSISYELPQSIKRKIGATGFKFYLQGENLFLITKYDGIDPEVQNFGGMPRPRTITAGLSCNF